MTTSPEPSTTLDRIRGIAREHLRRDEPLSRETRLVEDLALDSIQLLTLAVEVENHFRVCLDEDVDTEIRTIGDLIDAVEARLHA